MKECQQCKRCYSDEVSTCPDDGQPTFHSISGEPLLEGKYKLDRRLGQGGMGVVYCARHAYLKTQHAIKVILPDLVGNDPQLVTRFRQEALAAAAIRHHNVIAVTDFGVVQGTMPFLVMEFVEGDSLHDLLAREKRLSPERAVELMSAICAGVGAAHRQGIVHRDLKPLNIMICRDKHTMAEAVKILDFGLAKIKSGELLGSFIQAQTTGLMGSPYYMAPEQWADEEPDAHADVYSLGVMLFQMLAGDVPFKGSSIPAIMKKHLSDPPPSFAEFGLSIAPQLELAIRRTLEKDRSKRTQSVEQMVEELRSAIGYSPVVATATGQHATGGSSPSLPVSSIHILTSPPESKVFVDNVAVGLTQTNGWLLLEGLQSGNHVLRVSKDGFQDWQGSIVCDGRPQQIVAELQNTGGVQPGQKSEPLIYNDQNTASIKQNTPQSLANIQHTQAPVHQTAPPHQQTIGNQSAFAQSQYQQSQHQQSQYQQSQQQQQQQHQPSQPKKSLFSPLFLAVIGICGLLLLTGIGVVSAYWMGWIGPAGTGNVNNATPTPTASPTSTVPPVEAKNEMVKITGGKFKMGRNDGAPTEQPEHEVEVPDFWMDKTEVTNAEYLNFVTEMKYPAPTHWVNGKPIAGQELFPMVYVSIDDVKKFAEWRSKRDSVSYRLPTEQEWEYAARNGGENNLYPWGDSFAAGDAARAIVDQNAAKAVGTIANGANTAGVQDLIGNVWEWTSSNIKPYPGSKVAFSKPGNMVIRGGSFNSKSSGDKAITSTTRYDVEPTRKDGLLGFRLVRSDK